MVTTPADTPVTMPVLPTVANKIFPLLHTPPLVTSESVVVHPAYTLTAPGGNIAAGLAYTVKVEVA